MAAKAFEGFIVLRNFAGAIHKTSVPTYVIEFLLGRYCATTNGAEIQEGLEIVKRQLQDRTVRPGEEEYFKSKARERVPSSSLILLQLVWMRHQIAT